MDNYPMMSASELEAAPFNQSELESREFQITCSQTLSKSVKVATNNYIPGSSGIDCEPDGEGGYIKTYYTDHIDTSNTNWNEEYTNNNHKTPIELIQMFKETLKQQLNSWEGMEDEPYAKKEIYRIEHLIEECSDWCNDETEYIED